MHGVSGIGKTLKRIVAPRILVRVLKAAAPAVSLIILGSCDNPPTQNQPSYDFQVDPENIRNLVVEISSRNRRIFTDGNRETETYLDSKLRELLEGRGEVALQPIEVPDIWRSSLEAVYPGIEIDEIHNVVASIPGRDHSKKLVITAHLDSVGEGIRDDVAPGADDNASGLAVLLEIARNLAGYEFPFDIEIVAFNSEEFGKLGSKTYINRSADGGRSILAVINLDTLGNHLAGDRLVVVVDKLSGKLADLFLQANLEGNIVGDLERKETACASDECSFRAGKIPAVMVSENSNPVAEAGYPGNMLIHTSADTSGSVNPELAAKAARLVLEVLAGISTRGWEELVRPQVLFAERDFYFTATLGEENLFLTVQEEENTGLTYGLFYDRQGNPRYRLELGFLDGDFGLIRRMEDESVLGRINLPIDPLTGRAAEPLDLNGLEIFDAEGALIGRIAQNSTLERPDDTESPMIEILDPVEGEEILVFPGKGILLRGRTEPGLGIEPETAGHGAFESERDGSFEVALPFSDILDGTETLTATDDNHNASGVTRNVILPRTDRNAGTLTLRFFGNAMSLADMPNWTQVADRIAATGAGTSYQIIIDPAQFYDFEGVASSLGTVRISMKDLSAVERLPKVLASIMVHEFFHQIDRMDADWLVLYQRGMALGTWDLLDDSVLTNYYSWAGHPKGLEFEGFASAGQAYTLFPATFRRMIDLLALGELPPEPFGENENLNRLMALIWEQSPDRAALRQNLIDIYNYYRDSYFFGSEFASDI